MNTHKIFLGILGFMALTALSNASILVSWDSNDRTNTAINAPDISGDLFTNFARFIHTDSNSQDGTFGSLFSGAHVADPPSAAGGAWAIGLGGNDGSSSTRNNRIDFRVNNDSLQEIQVTGIHFDAVRRWENAGTELTLMYAYGDLNVTDGTVIGTSGSLPLIDGTAQRISTVWASLDFNMTSLADFSLAPGEYAVFRLESNLGESGWSDIMVDNLAITGVIPEPATYALFFGVGILALVLLRRRRG